MTWRKGRRARDDLWWGVSRGLGMGVVYALWVLVVQLVAGDAPFARYGVTVWQMAATYIAITVAAGGIVGFLRPLTHHPVGAYVVGVLAGLPICFGLMTAAKGPPTAWSPPLKSGFWLLCLMAGLAFGHEIRRRAKDAE